MARKRDNIPDDARAFEAELNGKQKQALGRARKMLEAPASDLTWHHDLGARFAVLASGRVAPELTVKGRNGLKFEEFADRPDVVGPAGGHRRRPLLPLLALLLPPAQAAVLGAEVVHAPHQVHPLLQHLPLMHQPPPSPRQ